MEESSMDANSSERQTNTQPVPTRKQCNLTHSQTHTLIPATIVLMAKTRKTSEIHNTPIVKWR